jgi:FkbM family methyltransferase
MSPLAQHLEVLVNKCVRPFRVHVPEVIPESEEVSVCQPSVSSCPQAVAACQRPVLSYPQEILARWNEHIERYRGCGQGTGQELLEKPYILQTGFHGTPLQLLIATVSGQDWYDKFHLYLDLELLSHFEMIRPGDIVFDLGAHQGLYSVILQTMTGSEGRVYAFDPFPMNADIVRFNSLLNHSDLQVFNVGVGKQRQTLKASVGNESTGITDTADAVEVVIDKLDNYAYLKPDFLKVDIEGAEIDALASAPRMLKLRPNMMIEVHTSLLAAFGREVHELFDVLPLHDYTSYMYYPGLPLCPLDKDHPFKEHFTIFLMKDQPVRRIYS